MRLCVAVDVGGSGLRLTAGYAARPARVFTAPGARVGAGGLDVQALVRDARSLLAQANPEGDEVEVVAWSTRGLMLLDRDLLARRVREALGPRRVVIASDAVASLVGAVGGLHPGAVVAAGTGAVAFGSDFARHWRRVDGWGHLLGDHGSAAVIGLEGLRAALRAHDGRDGGSQALLDAGAEHFGPPDSWPRLVMTSRDAPEKLASFAPVVTAAAAAGDAVAMSLCAAAGAALADSLIAAAKGLSAPRLSAVGGVMAAQPIRTALHTQLAQHGHTLTRAKGGALEGAWTLASELAERDVLPQHPSYLVQV